MTLLVRATLVAPFGGWTAVTLGAGSPPPPPLGGNPSGTDVLPVASACVRAVVKLQVIGCVVQLPFRSQTGAEIVAVYVARPDKYTSCGNSAQVPSPI